MPQNPFINTNKKIAPRSVAGAAADALKRTIPSLPNATPPTPDPQQALDMWGQYTNRVVGEFAPGLFNGPKAPSQPSADAPTPPSVDSGSTSPFANRNNALATQSLAGAAIGALKSLPWGQHGSFDPDAAQALSDDINANTGKLFGFSFGSPSSKQVGPPASAPPIPDPAFPKAVPQLNTGGFPREQAPPDVYTLPGASGGKNVTGLAKYGGKPGDMYKDGSFDNFAKGQYKPQDNGVSLEELFKIANSPQNETYKNELGQVTGGTSHAPGAQQLGQEMLTRRLGEPSDSDLALMKVLSPQKVAETQAGAATEGERIKAKGALDVAGSRASAMDAAMQAAFATGKPIQSFGSNPQSGAFHATIGPTGGAAEKTKIDGIIAQLMRDHSAGAISDEDYKTQLDHWTQMYGGVGGGQPQGAAGQAPTPGQDVDQFVQQLKSRYPQATSQQLLQVLEDPNGDYQGFDSDADKQILIQAFQRHGIR